MEHLLDIIFVLMKIKLLVVGKTNRPDLADWIDNYIKRIRRYMPFEWVVVKDAKKTNKNNPEFIKNQEGIHLLNLVSNDDVLILLDERGKSYTSVAFSKFIEQQALQSTKSLVFCVGGAYGFSEKVRQRANGFISLSNMTFSHQMIRIFAIEQIYRAMTIIKNEPYHNS